MKLEGFPFHMSTHSLRCTNEERMSEQGMRMEWDGCGVGVINNECIVDQGREGRGLVRIGLSAVVIVLAAFPVPARPRT